VNVQAMTQVLLYATGAGLGARILCPSSICNLDPCTRERFKTVPEYRQESESSVPKDVSADITMSSAWMSWFLLWSRWIDELAELDGGNHMLSRFLEAFETRVRFLMMLDLMQRVSLMVGIVLAAASIIALKKMLDRVGLHSECTICYVEKEATSCIRISSTHRSRGSLCEGRETNMIIRDKESLGKMALVCAMQNPKIVSAVAIVRKN